VALSRRVFLKGVSSVSLIRLGGSVLLGHEGRRTVRVDEPADLHPLKPVPIENVTIEDEFWTPKRDVWRSVTLWDCFRKFEEHQGGVLNNFDRVRDGQKGGHAGLPWFDGLIYEMIRGASDFLRSQPDPELKSKLDGYVTRIVAAAAKDPGGYVNTFTQLNEPEHRWGLNGGLEVWQHEFYNLGALVDAAVHYLRATGDTRLLEAAVRVANTISELVGPPPKLNLVPAHELPEEAMLGLYELLESQLSLAAKLPGAVPKRYLSLAEFWIENRGHHSGKPDWEPNRSQAEEEVRKFDYSKGRPSWGAYAQDHVPVFEQEEIVGHAVRATLLCSAIAATARVNGRQEYAKTALRLWENMTFRRMHITGGVGAYAEEEKFGPDYVLPNDAYLETCAAVGAGFFHQNMNQTFGHARYADELERVLYNGVLCGVSLAGDTYTYVNPLIADEGHERWKWHDCPCCPPMFLKIMGAMPGYIYATDADSAYVNLFVGGHASMNVGGTDLVIRQKTEYPWSGKVRIDVEPATEGEFALMLRVPAWCKVPSLRINGQPLSTTERVRGYVRIARTWKQGDHVDLDLPMPAEALRPDPRVKANVGRVALVRGPLVYCLEFPEAHSTTLAQRPEFKTERREGMVQIHATAADGRRFEASPFYANGNHGPMKLAVWIPSADPNPG
jgi:DUF1680 family protein